MLARLAVATVVLAALLTLPLRLSADPWAYAAYGALIGHGLDPWAHAYRAVDVAALRDPVLNGALRAWDGSLPRDVYGPLFTLPSAALVAATRSLAPEGTVWTFRLLAAAALLACITLAARTRPRLAPLLAFHPVVLWSAAEGHNDVLWLALVLAADRFPGARARVGTLVAAAAVKAVALVPLARAIAASRAGRLPYALAAGAVLIAAYAPLIHGVAANGFDHGVGPPRLSLVHAAALAAWSGSAIPLVVGLCLTLAGLAAVGRAFRDGDRLAGAALAGWIALPGPEPWYALWLLPVVALVRPSPASWGLLAASLTGAAGYVQDLVAGTTLANPALLGGTMLAIYALPLLIAAISPAPSPLPPPGAPPTPPPLVSPTPSPAPTPLPVPSGPPTAVPTTAPSPSATASLFNYITDPPAGGDGAPRIVEIALNDRIMHKGGMLLVKVTTSNDVTSVIARTMGREIGIPQGAPGYFAGQQQLPDGIPFFMLNRTYQIEFVASTADGRSATFSLPLRLER